jgi:hypothetical protein
LKIEEKATRVLYPIEGLTPGECLELFWIDAGVMYPATAEVRLDRLETCMFAKDYTPFMLISCALLEGYAIDLIEKQLEDPSLDLSKKDDYLLSDQINED